MTVLLEYNIAMTALLDIPMTALLDIPMTALLESNRAVIGIYFHFDINCSKLTPVYPQFKLWNAYQFVCKSA